MSFSDRPPPPPPFLRSPYSGGVVGGFWPQISMNNEDLDSNSHFEHAPLSKRPKYCGNYQENSVTFRPLNPRINLSKYPPMIKGTGHIFFKTRMCLKFLEGNCPSGEFCTFAHGAEELRDPPPNWQEIVAAQEKDKGTGNLIDDQRIMHKMKICRMFYNGEKCSYGDNCNFLHVEPSKFRQSSGISIGTRGPLMGHSIGSDQPEVSKPVNATADACRFDAKHVYWKTKFCSRWESTGQCPFGERCHYAHGLSELQVPGGRTDAKVVDTLTTLRTPDFVPNKTMVIGPAKNDGEHKKCLSKWKGTKKINRIYADWIEDLTLPQSLPSQV